VTVNQATINIFIFKEKTSSANNGFWQKNYGKSSKLPARILALLSGSRIGASEAARRVLHAMRGKNLYLCVFAVKNKPLLMFMNEKLIKNRVLLAPRSS